MSKVKAVLFDADGVVITSSKPFSHTYAAQKGFSSKEIAPFFEGDFQKALVGQADLKDILEKNRKLWRYEGEISDLIVAWLKAEDHLNAELITFAKRLKKEGVMVYLATNQEGHRTKFISEKMLPGVFNKIFSSALLGVKKPSLEFYEKILQEIAASDISPSEMIYFDDDEANVNAGQKVGIPSFLYTKNEDVFAAIGDKL